MEDFDQLTKGWRKITADAAIENRKLFKNKNTSIMESVLAYEQNEKQEKQKQIILLLIGSCLLAGSFAFYLYMGEIELTYKNLFGVILLLIAFGFSIISNKTDDFPDARKLDSLSYLNQLKENVASRRKRHIVNSFISIIFVLPGLYLVMYNLSLEYLPNYVTTISAFAGFIGGMYIWRKKYDETTMPLLKEIEVLLKEM